MAKVNKLKAKRKFPKKRKRKVESETNGKGFCIQSSGVTFFEALMR